MLDTGVQLPAQETYLNIEPTTQVIQPGHPSVGTLNEYQPKGTGGNALRPGRRDMYGLVCG